MTRDAFISAVKETITTHNLLKSKNAPVIVALSGGADSVALLSALCELGVQCIAAHCNFHLRGDESNRDEQHARHVAKQLNCEIIVKNFDVKNYCQKHNESSIEVACRELRYEWFDELSDRYNAQAIAVGHNTDDNCETFLFNIFRGSGITGLHGILPKNNRHVVRPLINCTRADIESYLSECGLQYITDSSNLTTDFSRNKIRNAILPEIVKWFSSAKKGIQRTISNISEQEIFYKQCIDEKRRYYSDNNTDNSINLLTLIASESTPELLVYEWFKGIGMTRTQANDIIKSKDNTGAKFICNGAILSINRGRLLLHYVQEETTSINNEIEQYFTITEHHHFEFNPSRDVNVAYFDKSVLEGTPLSVRFLRAGDSMKPFGMNGRKKVSDIMSEANIPAMIKNQIPLLVKGDEILWISGVRASSQFKVTKDTKVYLRVQYNATVQK